MTDKELMEQALEALQAVRDTPASKDEIQRTWIVCNLLQKRLAQPEQKPVAWYRPESETEWEGVSLDGDLDAAQKAGCIPLYITPPRQKWVGLTDEEEMVVGVATGLTGIAVRMIEAKLRKKNNG